MKLSISNIAWSPENSRAAYKLMANHGAHGLEIAPALAFPQSANPFCPSDKNVNDFLAELESFEIFPVSMQSLLYGVPAAQLFGSPDDRRLLIATLTTGITLAARLGIPHLVFGSPANRRFPDTMTERTACEEAAEAFGRLGNIAQSAGVTIGIEPNPAMYGTNFLTTVAAAAAFVSKLGHPAIGLNFDIGALIANSEKDIEGLVGAASGKISHVHLSEPQLAPALIHFDEAKRAVLMLSEAGYKGWFSIEMTKTDEGLQAVDAALQRARRVLSCCDGNSDA